MGDTERPDRRGTVWDWPVPIMLVLGGAILWKVLAGQGDLPVGALLGLLVAALIWMIRRGSLSPRRR